MDEVVQECGDGVPYKGGQEEKGHDDVGEVVEVLKLLFFWSG